jgi:hypothetical protein
MTGKKADKKAAVRSKKAVQKPRKPDKRAGSQGTAVKGGRMPGMPNRPAGKKVETPGKGAGKTSRDLTKPPAMRFLNDFWLLRVSVIATSEEP